MTSGFGMCFFLRLLRPQKILPEAGRIFVTLPKGTLMEFDLSRENRNTRRIQIEEKAEC